MVRMGEQAGHENACDLQTPTREKQRSDTQEINSATDVDERVSDDNGDCKMRLLQECTESGLAEKVEDVGRVTYRSLLANNPKFCWFIVSYTITNCGEWLTYVASMALIGENSEREQHYLISILVVARLVPTTLLGAHGGILADSMDRRQVMLLLDLLGALVALSFLSVHHSIPLLFTWTVLQSSVAGLYEPSRSAILPMLVTPESLAKANALSAMVWSLTAAGGSSLGGFIVSRYGPTTCFLTDSLFYVLSALILAACVNGDFCVIADDEQDLHAVQPRRQMLHEVVCFLRNDDCGPYVLIKACGALLFGASDVINVTFSRIEGDLNSQRLGWMFSAVGVGCLMGPLSVSDNRSYLKACIGAYFCLGVGYAAIGLSRSFWQKCFWTVLRSAGTAVLWVDSSILLQTACPNTMLGRVMAVDFGLALLGESLSAVGAGFVQDLGVSANHVALCLSGMGFLLSLLWSLWEWSRKLSVPTTTLLASIELKPLHGQ